MNLIWKKTYETGIKNIDAQHKNFIELVNDLYNLVEENNTEGTEKILKKLKSYAILHFKSEEELFDEYDYDKDEINLHLKKHQEFNDKITELESDLSLSKNLIAYRLAEFLRKWLIDHILDYDLRYARFIKNKNLNN